MTKLGLMVAGWLVVAGPAWADVISVAYGAAGVQTVSTMVSSQATKLGTESFDGRTSGSFVTDFGTGGAITGTYRGASIAAANLYGGAGGTGNFVQALGGTAGYTINFTTAGVPGVNYFGYWLSALDSGNDLLFKRAGQTVASYTSSDLISALGACSASNPYCGNPTAAFKGQDAGEAFVFVNFVDMNGFFDEIDLMESPNVGNYESDNHTVGYCPVPSACVSGIAVAEPSSVALLVTVLAGSGLLWLRKRRDA